MWYALVQSPDVIPQRLNVVRLRVKPFLPKKLKRKPLVPSLSGLVAKITNMSFPPYVCVTVGDLFL